jgi:hypothetical protein
VYIVDATTRYTVQGVDGADKPVLILRAPSSEELRAHLAGRFKKGGKATDPFRITEQLMLSREAFVDSLLVDCENVGYLRAPGDQVPLGQSVPGWKSKIPVNWKTSIAMKYEEQEVVSSEEERD